MATATATRPVRWVVCADFAAGPFTEAAAEAARARYDGSVCQAGHWVTISAVKPSTAADIAPLWHQWADPEFDGDRDALLAELAGLILDAPLMTRAGGLVANHASWAREASARADRAAEKGSDAWWIVLGSPEVMTLTADGRGAEPSRWCRCAAEGVHDEVPAEDWVRYERWTAEGCVAHGFVHRDCRRLIQAG